MMVKNEQLRDTDQLKRAITFAPAVSHHRRLSMLQTTSPVIRPRLVDPLAIDISSIKGRFAWEKIALDDTYMPVIFRGTTKYFCIKMLHKLLPGYPEDFIHRLYHYQYRKQIDLYVATQNEIELLNQINAHHSHWAYSRQPFTSTEELVRVSDFLPLYDHLRLSPKSTPIPRTTSTASLRSVLPQAQQTTQRSPNLITHMSNIVRGHSTISSSAASTQIQCHVAPELSRENTQSVPRSIAPITYAPRPSLPPKFGVQQLPSPRHSVQYTSAQRQKQLLPTPIQQPIAMSSNTIVNSTNTVRLNNPWAIPISTSISHSSTPTTAVLPISSSSLDGYPLMVVNGPKLLLPSLTKQLTPTSKQLLSSPSVLEAPRLNSGWLQINKLYTPYISTSTSNHHLHKIPVSLLTFYDLLKVSSLENNTKESKDLSLSIEHTRVTPQEIELINELCLKQNIKPFSVDTKLIDLFTFYQHCSANILFVKELPLNEPKASICKEWPSVVKINGGICRLRNIATLHEQTVPFIGNNLLKTFIISSQCLSSASLTIPTASEIEFLQLILFFSNMSVNLHNAKLVDIESVRKEYNVDLILLFNDKFPLNVLNYQQQDNRPAILQGQVTQPDASAAANTFAQSTPPPSPPSPPTKNNSINPTAQLPLTPSSSTSSNRYHKTIQFRGRSMTAYICSGLGSNAQRECISVKELCNMLYPNSSIMDKLETKMLRLLRLKNINRFRPQNQHSMGFTRLIDVKDIEKHWDYIEEGMRSFSNNVKETNVPEVASSISNKDLKASTVDKIENKSKTVEPETSIEVDKGEKRTLAGESNEDDVPVLDRVFKRVRFLGKMEKEQLKSTETIDNKYKHLDVDVIEENDGDDQKQVQNRRLSTSSVTEVGQRNSKKKKIEPQNEQILNKSPIISRDQIVSVKKKIKLNRKRPTPSIRPTKQTKAMWVQKYSIEECCIRLDLYNPIYDTGKD